MILSVIFDEGCLLCGRTDLFSRHYALCRRCFSGIVFAPKAAPGCRKCSRQLVSESEICMRCRNEDFAFGANYSLGEYCGSLKKVIGLYKFKDRRKLARLFALMIHRFLEKHADGMPVLLVPAPCSRKRMKEKGYNHMLLVCRILKQKYGVSVFGGLRRYRGRQLKLLNRDERKKELAGKIYMKEKDIRRFRAAAEGKQVFFVDDIFTTGTTASVCCRVLEEKGGKKADVITLALD